MTLNEALDAYEEKFGKEFPCYGLDWDEIPKMIEACIKSGKPFEIPGDVLV